MPTLNAPARTTFLISLALVVIAILGTLVVIPAVTPYAFWIAMLGYLVLALGCLLRGF